jgi:hypothetical protein
LIERVVWLHFFKASGANEDPFLRFINANAIKNIVGFLAPLAGLGSNTFNRHMTFAYALSETFDLPVLSGLPKTCQPACKDSLRNNSFGNHVVGILNASRRSKMEADVRSILIFTETNL